MDVGAYLSATLKQIAMILKTTARRPEASASPSSMTSQVRTPSATNLGARGIQVEVAIDLPPLHLKVVEEVLGVATLDGKAAGKAGVDVGVGVHQAGHDDATLGVHVLGTWVLLLKVRLAPHGDDLLAIDGDGARLEVGIVLVAGDDATVSDKQHMRAPFFVGGGV